MATSGRVEAGGPPHARFYFQWQLAGQDIGGNYSAINWQWGINIDPGGYYWGSNALKSVSGYINGGLVFGGNTWSNISGTGDHTLLASSTNIGHNGDGTKAFGISSTGWSYGDGNYSNSGAWDLPTIPRHASITGASGTIDDETPNYAITFNNPAGTAVDAYLDLPGFGVGGFNHAYNYGSGNPISMATDLTAIRTAMVNAQVATVRYVIHDALGGDSYQYLDYLLYIKNDVGQANPTFTTWTYKDTNATTTAITGNDQYLIQGYSTLQAKIALANKATPNKNANMQYYNFSIGGYTNTAVYSSSADVIKDIGVVSDVTGAKTLAVSAYDTRHFFKTVNQTVNILPYEAPIVNATAIRANGYDDALILTVAGSVSPLTISSVDKNSIRSSATSTANRVEYRFATDGGSYGSWTDLAATQTAATGAVTGNSTVLLAASGAASSSHSFQVQVKITDKLNSTTQTINVATGIPIFRIGSDGQIYVQEVAYQSYNTLATATTINPVGLASLNMLFVTALAANTTISAPTGTGTTATNGNRLIIRIKDNGTSRTLTWASGFRNGDTLMPTATTASKTVYVGFVYNSADGKWDCVLNSGGLT